MEEQSAGQEQEVTAQAAIQSVEPTATAQRELSREIMPELLSRLINHSHLGGRYSSRQIVSQVRELGVDDLEVLGDLLAETAPISAIVAFIQGTAGNSSQAVSAQSQTVRVENGSNDGVTEDAVNANAPTTTFPYDDSGDTQGGNTGGGDSGSQSNGGFDTGLDDEDLLFVDAKMLAAREARNKPLVGTGTPSDTTTTPPATLQPDGNTEIQPAVEPQSSQDENDGTAAVVPTLAATPPPASGDTQQTEVGDTGISPKVQATATATQAGQQTAVMQPAEPGAAPVQWGSSSVDDGTDATRQSVVVPATSIDDTQPSTPTLSDSAQLAEVSLRLPYMYKVAEMFEGRFRDLTTPLSDEERQNPFFIPLETGGDPSSKWWQVTATRLVGQYRDQILRKLEEMVPHFTKRIVNRQEVIGASEKTTPLLSAYLSNYQAQLARQQLPYPRFQKAVDEDEDSSAVNHTIAVMSESPETQAIIKAVVASVILELTAGLSEQQLYERVDKWLEVNGEVFTVGKGKDSSLAHYFFNIGDSKGILSNTIGSNTRQAILAGLSSSDNDDINNLSNYLKFQEKTRIKQFFRDSILSLTQKLKNPQDGEEWRIDDDKKLQLLAESLVNLPVLFGLIKASTVSEEVKAIVGNPLDLARMVVEGIDINDIEAVKRYLEAANSEANNQAATQIASDTVQIETVIDEALDDDTDDANNAAQTNPPTNIPQDTSDTTTETAGEQPEPEFELSFDPLIVLRDKMPDLDIFSDEILDRFEKEENGEQKVPKIIREIFEKSRIQLEDITESVLDEARNYFHVGAIGSDNAVRMAELIANEVILQKNDPDWRLRRIEEFRGYRNMLLRMGVEAGAINDHLLYSMSLLNQANLPEDAQIKLINESYLRQYPTGPKTWTEQLDEVISDPPNITIDFVRQLLLKNNPGIDIDSTDNQELVQKIFDSVSSLSLTPYLLRENWNSFGQSFVEPAAFLRQTPPAS